MEALTILCKKKSGKRSESWYGRLVITRTGNPCEAELSARGSYFHLIVGRHSYGGNYLCIPNMNIGSELAGLDDTFWNDERLQNYSKMRAVDRCSVTTALTYLESYM